MSSITFRSKERKVSIGGSERAYLGMLGSDLAFSMFGLDMPSFDIEKRIAHIRKLMNPKHYLMSDTDPHRFCYSFRAAVSGYGGQDMFRWGGQSFSGMTLLANTAMIIGSDPVRLGMRLHNQCEVHTFVEGPNRKWLAGIIAQGRRSGLYRNERQLYDGWDAVIRLLDEADDGPVVTYYSVTESFPNAALIGMNAEMPEWEALTDEFAWDVCVAHIRERCIIKPGWDIEMKPDTWADYRFGNRLSVLDIMSEDYDDRLDRALGVRQVPMEYKGG